MANGLTEKKKKYATSAIASKGTEMMMAFFKFVVMSRILRRNSTKNRKLDLLNCVKIGFLVLLVCYLKRWIDDDYTFWLSDRAEESC